ncbi:hypothetical protein AVEN_239809-1 [Araneus ventricosus]|uniref:CRISP/Allergen/PR-1 n=1 Tax=Araneus ventricosus TaxID=182803 RepID=A0A4Y2EVV0_ARAVE|nr:hypothetical protein AVEN_239809-1 [Araneus ventricosus]
MRLVFFLVLFNWTKFASSEECPAAYRRLSATHTFCLKPNPKCDAKFSGVSKKDRDLIVKLHNNYRNIIATGKETRAIGGALPKAADMLQMQVSCKEKETTSRTDPPEVWVKASTVPVGRLSPMEG